MRTYSELLADTARAALVSRIGAGAALYDRAKNLPRLLPVGPDDIAGPEPQTTRRIVLRLAKALRIERQRGRSGHWTYDLNRHLGLAQAYRAESNRLGARNAPAEP